MRIETCRAASGRLQRLIGWARCRLRRASRPRHELGHVAPADGKLKVKARHEDRRHRSDIGHRRALLPAVGRRGCRRLRADGARHRQGRRRSRPTSRSRRALGRASRPAGVLRSRGDQGAFAERPSPAGPVDLVLIAHGWLSDQQSCQDDLALCRESLEVNAVSPVLFAEAFAAPLRQGRPRHDRDHRLGRGRSRPQGQLHLRRQQGADRRATPRACEHRFAGSGVKVVLIKPGPTDTPMTAAQKARGPEARPGRAGRARDGERHPARPADGLHAADLAADHADRAPHPALRVQPAVDLTRRALSACALRASRSRSGRAAG